MVFGGWEKKLLSASKEKSKLSVDKPTEGAQAPENRCYREGGGLPANDQRV